MITSQTSPDVAICVTRNESGPCLSNWYIQFQPKTWHPLLPDYSTTAQIFASKLALFSGETTDANFANLSPAWT